MIYTCTLNPSLDYFVEVDQFRSGTLNRIDAQDKMPGGKGINVSRVLSRLDVQNCALGFIGGFTGDFIRRRLIGEGVESDFSEVNDDTRINVKVKSDVETEINGMSPAIPDEAVETLMQKVAQMSSGDILVLSGSIPGNLPATIYQTIMKTASDQGIKTVVDTSGSALEACLGEQPFLIKPNEKELGALFDTDIQTSEEAVFYARQLLAQGAQNVIVSLGGEGAIFVNDEHAIKATTPQGELKNSVGSGDSLVAGFLAKWSSTDDAQEAFRYGVAAGSATAFSVDLCQQKAVDDLVEQVGIEPINGVGE